MTKCIIIDPNYSVIVYRWDDVLNMKVERVVGSFNDYADALLFRDAYRDRWGICAKIVGG